ncbi:DUF6082 family protein [Streptomyces sp. UH6]|uniref:DUF6082 family protein n=1 Tax=Streptomyces sp. UH6 TaxID=2748379 RepID=UPI0015D4B468|nr:DUF6082 family protein [Streptomyces sp. UH6]NYV73961.1 hypothetical protein [Streptomyces sp. UH6]
MATRFLRSAVAACVGAAAGAITATAVQRRALCELKACLEQHLDQARAIQREVNLTTQQRLHWSLMSKAFDDPDLAEVLDVYEGPAVTPRKRRQYLFANAQYTNLLFYYRLGNLTRTEFVKYARGLFQNPVMVEYWYATQHQRDTVPPDSDEAAMGRLIDDLFQQLDEAEEWWVAGDAPPE